MAALHGKQMVYVCLSSCVTDVALNAIILFFLTQSKEFTRPAAAKSAGSINLNDNSPCRSSSPRSKVHLCTPKIEDEPPYQQKGLQAASRNGDDIVEDGLPLAIEGSIALSKEKMYAIDFPSGNGNGSHPNFLQHQHQLSSSSIAHDDKEGKKACDKPLFSQKVVTSHISRTVETPVDGEITANPSDVELFPPLGQTIRSEEP